MHRSTMHTPIDPIATIDRVSFRWVGGLALRRTDRTAQMERLGVGERVVTLRLGSRNSAR
jgi:hypothetical protein